MSDPVIELELDPSSSPRHRAIPKRWLILSVAGLLVLAGAAIIAGRAQRPKPPPPHNYVSSPGFGLYTADDGDTLFEIVIHNYSGNPITVSTPAIVASNGADQVRLMLTLDEAAVPTPGSSLTWPKAAGSVVIPSYGEAALGVGYHVGCAAVGQKGPFITAARVKAVAGSVRSFRNVMPVLNPDVAYGKPYCPGR